MKIRRSNVPTDSLLGRYVTSGAYADCFVTVPPRAVTHAQFVEAEPATNDAQRLHRRDVLRGACLGFVDPHTER